MLNPQSSGGLVQGLPHSCGVSGSTCKGGSDSILECTRQALLEAHLVESFDFDSPQIEKQEVEEIKYT